MKDAFDHAVRRAVAHYLQREVMTLTPADHFEHDLGLEVLDVVLIAFRLEEVLGIVLPIDRLQAIETVGQLVNLVRAVEVAAWEEERASSPQRTSLRWHGRP